MASGLRALYVSNVLHLPPPPKLTPYGLGNGKMMTSLEYTYLQKGLLLQVVH